MRENNKLVTILVIIIVGLLALNVLTIVTGNNLIDTLEYHIDRLESDNDFYIEQAFLPRNYMFPLRDEDIVTLTLEKSIEDGYVKDWIIVINHTVPLTRKDSYGTFYNVTLFRFILGEEGFFISDVEEYS